MANFSTCPSASKIVYSPFAPASQSEYSAYTGATDSNYACWWWAICVLTSADEARKQQFAATSLVMGLVPLTLKDIAWPERRVVLISRHLPRYLEVIIRALGVVPSIDKHAKERATHSTSLYGRTQRLSYIGISLLAAITALCLGIAYTALAVMEVYSKRSSLGCPYPVFILTWYLVALIPAIIETIFRQAPKKASGQGARSHSAVEAATSSAKLGGTRQGGKVAHAATNESSRPSDTTKSAKVTTASTDQIQAFAPTKPQDPSQQGQGIPAEDMSSVPGRGKPWLVQLMWATYYIAGTLVYSSIMAVTVIELFVWVMISVATTAASKLLAFFLCMAVEKRWELARS